MMPEERTEETLKKDPARLGELCNIGMGHACTALSQMLNTRVGMTVPFAQALSHEKADEYIKSLYCGDSLTVMLGLAERAAGSILYLLNKTFVERVISTYFPCEIGDLSELDDMGMSVIQEMCNISSAAFCNSLASITGLFIDITTPKRCKDHLEALDSGKDSLVIDSSFLIDKGAVEGSLIFLPDEPSAELIMRKIVFG